MKRRFIQVHGPISFISAILISLFSPGAAHAQDDTYLLDPNRSGLWVLITVGGLLYVIFGALRWTRIARAAGSTATAKQHVVMWLAGEVMTRLFFVLPVGELYRWVRYSRREGRPVAFFGALIIEKILGLTAMLIVLLSSVLILLLEGGTPFARFRTLVFGILFIVVVVLIVATLLRPQALAHIMVLVPSAGIRKRLEPLLDSLAVYADRARYLLPVLGFSIGVHGGLLSITIATWGFAIEQIPQSWTTFLQAGLWYASPVIDRLLIDSSLTEILIDSIGDAAITGTLWAPYVGPLFTVMIPLSILAVAASHLPFSASQARQVVETKLPKFTIVPIDWSYTTTRASASLWKCVLYVPVGCAVAGFCVGVLEAHWLIYWGRIHDELRVLWWAPIAYALLGAVTGPFLGMGLAYVLGLRSRVTLPLHVALLALSLWLAGAVVVIGRFRYIRDILNDQPMSIAEGLVLGVIAILSAIVLTGLAGAVFSKLNRKFLWATMLGAAAVTLLVAESRFLVDPESDSNEREGMMTFEFEGPSIIFIGVDTLRADYLNMYNASAATKTPHLDAFRQDAVLLENFYATAPWTKPAFASMFTGLYPTEHRALGKGSVLPEEVQTLPELLLGYSFDTQGFPNNPNIHAQYGFAQGFQGYEELKPVYPFLGERSVFGTALYQVLRRARAAWLYPKVEVETHYRPAEFVTDAAKQWLEPRRRRTQSFFLFLHYMDPHDPYMPGDDSGHGMSLMELGLHPDPEEWEERFEEAYIDEIERMDVALGELFEFLNESEIYRDNAIVLVSDHGEEFFDHGGWWHGMTLYEEMLRVPCLIKLPKNERAGETYTGLASQVDLAPTILDVVGIETATEFSGRSLFREEAAVSAQEVFAESNFVGARLRTVRRGDLKYIDGRSPIHAPHEVPMLFDLEADAGEQENLAGAHDDEELMRQRLQEWEERLRAGRVR